MMKTIVTSWLLALEYYRYSDNYSNKMGSYSGRRQN